MTLNESQTVATLAAHLAARAINKTPNSPTLQDATGRLAGARAADAVKLWKLSTRARRDAERLCNIPNYQAAYDRSQQRILDSANEILSPYGLGVYVSGDPRGCCLHILGLPGNTLGGDSVGLGL